VPTWAGIVPAKCAGSLGNDAVPAYYRPTPRQVRLKKGPGQQIGPRENTAMNVHKAVVVAALIVIGSPRPSALAQEPKPPARGSLTALAWLAGTWTGTSGQTRFEERWTPAAGGAMLSVSRTLKGDTMAGFEFLRIVERAGTLIYVAQPGGRPPTEFTMTALSPDSVTFENPLHDFPKMIRYARLADGRLEARVSGGAEAAEVYVFTRQP
jgi:hypothetical protein